MTATSSTTSEYLTAPNRVVSAANGIDYAYREIGDGRRPSYCSSTSAGTSTTGIRRWSMHWRATGGS